MVNSSLLYQDSNLLQQHYIMQMENQNLNLVKDLEILPKSVHLVTF